MDVEALPAPILTNPPASSTGSEPDDDCCEACAVARATAHAASPIIVGDRALPVVEPAVRPAGPQPGDGLVQPRIAMSFPPTEPASPERDGPPSAGLPPGGPRVRVLPVLGPSGQPGVGIARSADRRITFGGLVVAALYVAMAAGSTLLPPAMRLGLWLPAHLALAGGAATAIAAVLPFFTAALAVARPAQPAIRIGGIGGIAVGAVAAMTAWSRADGQALPAALAGATFLGGLGLTALATFVPLRHALGPRRALMERAYGLALAYVAVGVFLAILFIGGNASLAAAWGSVKPAHAWLNLVGFACLVIVTTLLHLAPTIVGTRLRPRLSGRVAVVGVAVGAPVVALGYALRLDLLARLGATAALLGAVGVAAHAIEVHRDPDRGRWTTDAGWHRATSWSMLAGQAWLALGLTLAAARTYRFGDDPAGWSLATIVGPLLVGGVVQILLGAMTHLMPAIGPGDPLVHAAQRRLLGAAATIRVVAFNAGVALVSAGLWTTGRVGAPPAAGEVTGPWLVAAGLGTVAVGLGGTLAVLVLAATTPRRPAAAAGSRPRARSRTEG